MTQQYLVGELSQLLAQLERAATDPASVREAARLRREAETWPFAAMSAITARALALAGELSWSSLVRGDIRAFNRQAEIGAEMRRFGASAHLVEDV